MRRVAGATAAAVGGGRFFGTWTLIGSLPVALTVMGGYLGPMPLEALPLSAVASALAWVVSVAFCLLPAWAERRASRPRTRAAVVVSALIVVIAVRPPLLDLIVTRFGLPVAPASWLPFRLATNFLVWIPVLLGLAIAGQLVRTLRATNARLAAIEERMGEDAQRQQAWDAEARGEVARCADDLRRALLGDGPLDPTLVERFAQGPVRAWARRLSALAHADPAAADPVPTGPIRRGDGHRTPWFRLPPIGVIIGIYLAMVAPYALRTLGMPRTATMIVLSALLGTVIDLAPRVLPRRVPMPVRWAALLVTATGVGGVIATALCASGAIPTRFALVPILGLPALAAAVGRCSALFHGLRSEGRRLETSIRERRRRLLDASAVRTRALEEAARLVHRDVQGACVLLVARHRRAAEAVGLAVVPESTAARGPENPVAPGQELAQDLGQELAQGLCGTVSGAIAELEAVFDRAAEEVIGHAEIEEALDSWERIVEVDRRIDPDCASALDEDGVLSRQVLEIVSEGIVNAVKHADARRVRVRMERIVTGGGPELVLEVAASAVLPAGAALRADAPAALMGASLRQRGADAVLAARLPMGRVVSPAHFAGGGEHAR